MKIDNKWVNIEQYLKIEKSLDEFKFNISV